MKKINEKYLIIIIIILLNLIGGCKKEKTPVISTTAVSNITATTATSGGNITDEGSSTVISRGVCWSTSTSPTVADNKTTDGAGAGSFSSNITGLKEGIVYYVRAYSTNSGGTGYGMVMSFATLGKSPDPIISAATNINPTSVTLNGSVNPNYLSTTVSFEYGTTASYGSIATATQSPVTGNANTSVSAPITGLLGGTTYHVRIKGVNSIGTTYSNDLTFTTLGQVPSATPLTPTNINTTFAQLNGTVNAHFLSAVVTFEYGTTTSYGNSAAAIQNPITGNSDISVSASISGLTNITTYHFRLKAVNSLGTTYSSDLTFITTLVDIGATYQGGLVFYIDATGQHGLVCAPSDQSVTSWGCSGTIISGADGTSVGTGNQNTIDIVTGCNTAGIAARVCYDLVLNGYSDWFLPSIGELVLVYANLKPIGLGNFVNADYWSSSEYDATHAWIMVTSGLKNNTSKYFANRYVRAIRAF